MSEAVDWLIGWLVGWLTHMMSLAADSGAGRLMIGIRETRNTFELKGECYVVVTINGQSKRSLTRKPAREFSSAATLGGPKSKKDKEIGRAHV